MRSLCLDTGLPACESRQMPWATCPHRPKNSMSRGFGDNHDKFLISAVRKEILKSCFIFNSLCIPYSQNESHGAYS